MTDSTLSKSPFKLSFSEIKSIFKRDIYIDIISSSPFIRLKNIHFLGAIDFVIGNNETRKERQNTRYQHSLGVARLALIFAEKKNFNPDDEVLFVLAALLHDIGHAPLSHSMESVFVDTFNFGHHQASETILKGEIKNLASIWKIIDFYGINVFRIIEILNGVGAQMYREAFDYPINIDTIEGILRCIQMMPNYDVEISPEDVINELANITVTSERIFDQFWNIKNYAYHNLINSELGIIADYLCQDYMSNARNISEDFFYDSEIKFRKKHSKIFNLLLSLRRSKTPNLFTKHNIDYYERVFEIKRRVKISNIEDLKSRYIQHKVKKHLDW